MCQMDARIDYISDKSRDVFLINLVGEGGLVVCTMLYFSSVRICFDIINVTFTFFGRKGLLLIFSK